MPRPSNTGTVNIPTVTVNESGNVTVTISGTFTYGTRSTTTTGPVGCASICTTTATAESPLKAATINYAITRNSSSVANLVISLDLADLKASSSYQAAPSAG